MGNRKLKEFKKLVKNGEIDLRMWCVHFGDKRPDKCKCRDCVDYKLGECSGGIKPFDCMQQGIFIDTDGWEGA